MLKSTNVLCYPSRSMSHLAKLYIGRPVENLTEVFNFYHDIDQQKRLTNSLNRNCTVLRNQHSSTFKANLVFCCKIKKKLCAFLSQFELQQLKNNTTVQCSMFSAMTYRTFSKCWRKIFFGIYSELFFVS